MGKIRRIYNKLVDWLKPILKFELQSFRTFFVKVLQIIKTNFKVWLNPVSGISPLVKSAQNDDLQGFQYKGKTFVHHTDLEHHEIAHQVLFPRQKLWLMGGLIVLSSLLIFNWRIAVVAIIWVLTVIYFADLIFNLFVIWRSFGKPQEIKISKKLITSYPESQWPSYTIFCPLYKEWQVVPQFVKAIAELDYPKDKLQVILLLEEDDLQTIEKIKAQTLPDYFEISVVPHSQPKTKPKAMNYGLKTARGEYLVVYDAEDVPEPDQLKKAVLVFAQSSPSIICVQAKLNFYNQRQNVLTRLFTAEYSLWFDLVLPGLQSLNGPIPLGGTSNHFRTEQLKQLSGWDAFNVTEDCDLGMRLYKRGFRTAMVDSTTFEEASSNLYNWYRQRSRWIKGYIQTYLVHMRRPKEFYTSLREPHLLTFQLIIGGKVLSMFVNPLLWAVTFVYFAFRAQAAPIIEPFFTPFVLYTGVVCFVFGNFLALYYYMLGLAKRGLYDLIKYVALVPIYWLAISVAAWKAVYEIIYKPHYWQKTIHGMHLNGLKRSWKFPIVSWSPLGKVQLWQAFKKWEQSPAAGGVLLVAASMAANFFNFLFSALLGRSLSLQDFGVLTVLNTLLSLFGIVFTSLASSINFKTAFLVGREERNKASAFAKKVLWQWLLISGVATAIWILLIPVIGRFFNIDNSLLLALFSPVIVIGVWSSVAGGHLKGQFLFHLLARTIVAESLAKLVLAAGFVYMNWNQWISLTIPISMMVSFVMLWFYMRQVTDEPLADNPSSDKVPFPSRYFWAAILQSVALTVFLSVDVLLAKHYLSGSEAGAYSILSLVGKSVFFFGTLLSSFIVSIVSRHEGAKTDPRKDFYRLFQGTVLFTSIGFITVGLLGRFTVPFLFGSQAQAIVSMVIPYTGAMGIFAISTSIVSYHMAKRLYSFAYIPLTGAVVMIVSMLFRHDSITTFTNIVFGASVINLLLVMIAFALVKNARFVLRNITDLLDVLVPVSPAKPLAAGKKRILIFNWRDTEHAFAGGAEVYIHQLAKRWVSSGNQVLMFCGNDGQSNREDVIDGIKVVRRGGFYFVYLWAMIYYFVQFRGKFDVIVDCENGIPFFTPLYAKEKVYCLLHHVHQEVFRKYLNAPLAMIAQFLERVAMPIVYRDTLFITVSDSSKTEMLSLGIGLAGVSVVHPGVDLHNLEPGLKSKNPMVLYLGRLKAYKSVDVLIRAFALIKEKTPRAKLVIAGGGEESSILQRLAADLGFGHKDIEFTGRITEAEKISWLQQAWVFVNPSMIEGWGITSIEANACGVPVVASNVPGLRDSVKNPHTGYLVPHGDVEMLAERINRLIEHKPLRDMMGKEAITWASNFDWDRSAEKSLALILGEDI